MAFDASFAAVAVAVLVVIIGVVAMKSFGSSNSSSEAKPPPVEPGKSSQEEKKETPSYPAGPLTIYFGSQTGTAEGFSEQLKKEGQAKGFDTKVVDLDDFDADEFTSQRLSLLMLATYGEGEPTDNAAEFVKWLKGEGKDADCGSLLKDKMAFTVFGLGNRQYEHFNKVGTDVDKLLEKCGAERCFELGVGDDDGSLEEDFEAWKDRLWPQLVKKYHPMSGGSSSGALDVMGGADGEAAAAGGAPLPIPELPFTFSLVPDDSKSAAAAAAASGSGGPSQLPPSLLVSPTPSPPTNAHASTKHFFTAPRAKVVVNRELRDVPRDGGSTRHIEIDIGGVAGLEYNTADNLAVLAENKDEDVALLAEKMGFPPLTARFTLGAGSGSGFKPAFPTPCTVGEALAAFVDLSGMPRRTSLKDWAPFAQSAEERKKLLHLSSRDGKTEYHSLVEERQRSLLDLLTEDFPSITVPLAHFLHLAPALQPRYYTISSSSTAHPKRIHITVSVLQSPKASATRGSSRGVLEGVCSNQLARLLPPETEGTGKRSPSFFGAGSKEKTGVPRPPRPWPSCRVFVRPSSFLLPSDPKTPIVMVGPGTGIAPMRALLQERSCQRKALGAAAVGPSVLFFGCKDEACDFLYSDELKAFESEGTLTSLHLAFSRPGFNRSTNSPGASKKVYVQHLMAMPEKKAELWSLVDGGKGHVYVCGGTSMGADVGKALLEVVKEKLGGNASAAEKYVAGLKEQGRYVQELWA